MTTDTPKGRYHHGDLPNALLDAVEAIIAEDGVHAVSLRAAARRVGVSHAAPGHHFGDLHGLLGAVALRGHERFGTALRDAATGQPDAPLAERLDATGQAYMAFAAANPGVFEIMFRDDLVDVVVGEDGIPEGEGAFAVLTGLIAEGVGVTDQTHPDVLRLSMFTWAAVHGATELFSRANAQHAHGGDVGVVDAVRGSVLLGLQADPAWRAAGA